MSVLVWEISSPGVGESLRLENFKFQHMAHEQLML